MRIDPSIEMLPIYLALLCYGIAGMSCVADSAMTAMATLFKKARPTSSRANTWTLASFLYFAGFACAVVAFIIRWRQLGHVPLQSMFDVFLAMAIAIYPLTRFCRRLGGRLEPVDMLLGFAIIFPVAFVFPSEPQKLPPALQSFLFAPHVAVYLLGYVIMAKAAAHAVFFLIRGDGGQHRVRVVNEEHKVTATFETPDSKFLSQLGIEADSPAIAATRPSTVFRHQAAPDTVAFRLVCLGFPLLTAGLVLGSWWGQIAWGNFWGWDPKEMWSLATWLIFVLYFHCRYSWPTQRKFSSILVLVGFAAIVITILWVNLSRLFPGLHNYAGM